MGCSAAASRRQFKFSLICIYSLQHEHKYKDTHEVRRQYATNGWRICYVYIQYMRDMVASGPRVRDSDPLPKSFREGEAPGSLAGLG